MANTNDYLCYVKQTPRWISAIYVDDDIISLITVMVSKTTEIKKNTVGRLIKATTEISEKGENLEKPLEKEKNW